MNLFIQYTLNSKQMKWHFLHFVFHFMCFFMFFQLVALPQARAAAGLEGGSLANEGQHHPALTTTTAVLGRFVRRWGMKGIHWMKSWNEGNEMKSWNEVVDSWILDDDGRWLMLLHLLIVDGWWLMLVLLEWYLVDMFFTLIHDTVEYKYCWLKEFTSCFFHLWGCHYGNGTTY